MALTLTLKETKFGIGDKVKVVQNITDGQGVRSQTFAGMVIKIKGEGTNKTFTVRRIGANQIGIEKVFPIGLPSLVSVEVTREGTQGVRHAKLYYTRTKSKREIEKIYSRTTNRKKAKEAEAKTTSVKSKPKPAKIETK